MAQHAATVVRIRAESYFKVIDECGIDFDEDVAKEVAAAVRQEAHNAKASARVSSLSDPFGG